MRGIEMRHLRYFVAVAQAGSVAAGARAAGIVQPALSRQIRELEDAVGTPLFIRRARGVVLTAAGESFLRDAQWQLAALQASCERALRAASGVVGVLRLGVLPSYLGLPRLSRGLQDLRLACPQVELVVEPMLSAAQVSAIGAGQIDAGVMAWRGQEAAHLSAFLLLREHFVLAMPEALVAQGGEPRCLADLAGAPFVWCDPLRSAAHHQFLQGVCAGAGFSPRIRQSGADMPTLIGLVCAGMGCAFVPQTLVAACPPGVRVVHLPELAQTFAIEFVYHAQTARPVVFQLLSALERAREA